MPNIPHNPLTDESRADLVIDLSGDALEEQVSIIIVHKDRPAYLNLALQSISVCSVNNNYEIIVVDNGSGKETQDFLDGLDRSNSGIKIIRNDSNLYWTKAANQGAKIADKNSSYFIFLHADCVILSPTWIDLLISVSDSSNSGQVGVQMSHYSMEGKRIDYIREFAMLVTREAWEACGSEFNPALPQIGAGFLFTLLAQAKGFKPRCVSAKILHHYDISSLDISKYEQFAERASIDIPKAMRSMPELTSLVKMG